MQNTLIKSRMVFDATKMKDYMTDPAVLRWTFNIASAGDMESLGALFGKVAKSLLAESARENKIKRVGLLGHSNRGKTTFSKGLVQSFSDREVIERPKLFFRVQRSWQMRPSGVVRLYDARVKDEQRALPSYSENDTDRFGFPLLDLVENAFVDANDRLFDCLVDFDISREAVERKTWDRTVTVVAGAELARTKAFREFLADSEKFRCPYTEDTFPVTGSRVAAPT